MTKQTERNVPQIRFKEFEGEWVEKYLGDLCSPLDYGLNAAATKFDGENKYLRITDIDDESRTFLSIGLTSPKTDLDSCQGYLLKQGDIVFARTGASVGKSFIYREEDGRVFFAGFLIRARTNAGESADFIFQNTLTKKYEKFVKLTSQRSGQPGINAKEYSSYSFFCPKKQPEKEKIGLYFRRLDSLIGLHQQKYEKLMALKQAMLQKMFPQGGATIPEIRFEGFTGDWEVGVLDEIMQPVSNNTLSREYLNYKSGPAKNIHYGDILVKFGEVIDTTKDNLPFISDLRLVGNITSSKLQDGDIIIADAAEDSTVGKCTEISGVGDTLIFSGLHTIALRPSLFFAAAYLGYFMNSNSFHDQLLPIMQGTKVLSVSKTAIKDTIIFFPNDINEQQKIGTYFRKLDELISQHATQLEKLKQIKSACLAKMFV